MTTSIEILKTIKPPLRWVPEHREFTEEFLRGKAKDSDGPSYEDLTSGDDSVLAEAQRILGRCLPPTEAVGRETGLVVGYVQSGKTMSFETVISLARDNGYGLVVVIAGTKNNLRSQSEDRLKKDLGIVDGDNWNHFPNPTDAARSQIENRLEAWRKSKKKKAVLVTVLKHGGHLEKLSGVLKGIPLRDIPALIIDDESDQASLNTHSAKIRLGTAAASEQSTTYNRIELLRSVIPHHSYLQYTATPQANLLMAQTDLLNPTFAELVTPGNSYTGGRTFFKENPQLLEDIPATDVPGENTRLTGSPKSLLKSLRFFLLACAHHALTRERGKDRNRSMMIHPAAQTQSHKTYKAWIETSLRTLRIFVEKQYKAKPDEVRQRFASEYASLKATYPAIKPLDELIVTMVDDVFGEMNWVEVNGTPDAEKKIDWKSTPYWILVGGANLDRGYTIEGLCVTYMPRPLGTSPAADTLQQRARFFGYKRAYLGMCRVFLQQNVRSAFTEYVEHEEFVREALAKARGKPLSEWRRDFVLSALLKPTRPNVVGLGGTRVLVHGWLVPNALQRDDDAATSNRTILNTVEKKWKNDYGPAVNAATLDAFKSPSGVSTNDIIQGVPLKAVLVDFLLQIRVKDPADAQEHNAALISLSSLLSKHPDMVVDVFLMNKLCPNYRTRIEGRGFSAKHRFAPINQYFSQTAGALNDRSYVSKERVTLQLRRFNLGTTIRDSGSADVLRVTWFALHVPSQLRKDVHVEDRA